MLETGTRKMIYDFIVDSPGPHLREIGRHLNITPGRLRYHLDRLERSGLIVSRRDGYYRRYFITRSLDAASEGTLCALRKRATRRILLYILNNPDATNIDIAIACRLSRRPSLYT